MRHLQLIRGLFVAFAALALSAAAQAQLFRAYVSTTGSDGNACTLALPCRLLPAALNAVVSGGEIWMLDSANYNVATVSIDKSVSILAVPGVVGSVVATGGPAITISASGLTVALRNVAIVPLSGGGGMDGASVTGASTLVIENGVISNLPGSGVVVSGTGQLKIANTVIRNNSSWAVFLQNGASAEISNTQMLSNLSGGVSAQGSVGSTLTTAAVSDSIVSGGSNGVFAYSIVSGATTKIFLARSTIEGTSAGLISQGSSLAVAACHSCRGTQRKK